MTARSLFLFLAFAIPLHAETWSGRAAITFDGTSTLHGWGGKVDAEPFKADVTLNGGKPKRVKAEVVVKAAGMDTAEPKRDANMRKAMKVTDHPLIIGKIGAPFDRIAKDGAPAVLPIELHLLGKPQKVSGTISNWRLKGSKATFDLDFPVSLKASGITVPAVLLFIKVGDGVKVHASVTLIKN